jgi:hypothetical protein
MKKIIREELYEKIWARPITHLAKEYGISDSAIIKICKKMEIPRPGLGHWARVHSGMTIKKAKLLKISKKGINEYWVEPLRRNLLSHEVDGQLNHPLINYERLTGTSREIACYASNALQLLSYN